MPSLVPVLVTKDGIQYLAFQADRLASGSVVDYSPGSPDAWYGSLAVVGPDKVQGIDVSFAEVLGICERVGRNSSAHLNGVITAFANRDSSAGN